MHPFYLLLVYSCPDVAATVLTHPPPHPWPSRIEDLHASSDDDDDKARQAHRPQQGSQVVSTTTVLFTCAYSRPIVHIHIHTHVLSSPQMRMWSGNPTAIIADDDNDGWWPFVAACR